jgi:urea transport system permease protein
MAQLGQRVEGEFVGVKGGMMDQYTAVFGREGHALLLDCRSLEAQPVPLPAAAAVVVMDTGAPRSLAASARPEARTQLAAMVEQRADGSWTEPDDAVRTAARAALAEVSGRLARIEWVGRIFAGLSLGSILMLAAIGLAITYGLLGVINMAHGEMIMIGAYATYLTQLAFRSAFPEAIAWYPVAALPVAFVAAAAVGIVIERTVIRWLYGRPLETLLATWGVSLVLIQAVRQLFGPQNVEIENPAWLSGGVQFGALVLPWNRIAIIVFSLAVLGAVALVLHRTRLGLFVRGVTQNRAMASAVGVPTDRVDMMAFGLGSGIAGLAGVALSQVGNVGPELGQAYVIDSFIVVVLGGVGQLLGTVVAGFGLGVANKLLEPWLGAVVAKIVILVLIIAFIQKRPSGLFALKGRAVET